MPLTNKVISQLLAFSEGGQKYLDTLLTRGADDIGLKQFDDPLQQIRYGGNIFQHTGPKGIDSYDLGAQRLNAGNSPLGIYATLKPRETNMYRGILEKQGIEPETYNLVSSARKTFVIGEDKPTTEMLSAYKNLLAKNDGYKDWASIPSDGPHKSYLEGKVKFFRETGRFDTDVSPKAQSDIYMAGGADSLLRNGNEFVFMKPNQTRDVRAKFDSRRANENNWFAGAAPVAAGGVLAALGMAPQEAEAGVFPYAFKMADDALQRGSALFSEKALKSAASDASGNSRTAITMMSPDEFLRVVPTPENSISQANIDKIAEHIRSGGKLDDVPFLTVGMDDAMKMARYEGHEGRHRALALKQLGIEEMPVRIKMRDEMGVRWDELHSGNPLTRKSLPDQVLHEGKGSTTSAFPIKKTRTGFETARSAAPVAAGGILGALGLPENATAADVVFAERPEVSKEGKQEVQQLILDTLMGFMAPQPLGDATMDAYNRNRVR